MNIAIIGAGVGGLTAAHELGKTHRVSLFEEAPDVGGHVRTVAVEAQGSVVPVDMGFIVYNERTYPRFVGLLAELGVATQASDMSLGSSCAACGIAFSSRGANGWFGSRNLLVEPRPRGPHGRRAALLPRRARDARRADRIVSDARRVARGAALRRSFRAHFLIPIVSAVWSTAPDRIDTFPIDYLLRFLDNHGLIGLGRAPQWRVIQGGSRTYAERIVAGLPRGSVRTGAPVVAVTRGPDGASFGPPTARPRGTMRSLWRPTQTPPGPCCAMRTRTSGRRSRGFEYTTNQVVLHTDSSILPRSRRAWGSWNIATDDCRRPGGSSW